MKEINILILSAGRRVELINCFKEARDSLRIKGKVIAADLSDTAPAIYYADKQYLVCRIDHNNYINEIIDICRQENISLVVPTIDTELEKLSKNKNLIEKSSNAKVLISDEEVIKICRDKYKTQKFFEDNGFNVPKLIKQEDILNRNYNFPLFIKPLDGSSSINTFKINNEKELEFFYQYVQKPIIQEFIEGEEYTVDVFTDFNSKIITIVPRKRIATRSGEISKGIITKDREIINEVKKVIEKLNPIGQITIQCMKTNKGIEFIEINPRFGGGVPISIKAGANSSKNIYKLLLGEALEYTENYEDKLLALRYDAAIFINSEGEIV